MRLSDFSCKLNEIINDNEDVNNYYGIKCL